jgi:hypothetical protein
LALAEVGRFLGLGLRDIAGVHRDHAGAALVRRHHHPMGLALVHAEHRLKHLHHELARRVVVVEQDHFVERRPRRLRRGLRLELGRRLVDDFVGHLT